MKSSEFLFVIYRLIEAKRNHIFIEADERRRINYNFIGNPLFPAPENRRELEYILLTSEITEYYRSLMKTMIEVFFFAKENAHDNLEESLFQLVKDYKIFPVYTSLYSLQARGRTPETKILFERLNSYKPTLQEIGLSPDFMRSLKYDHAKFKEMFNRFNLREVCAIIYDKDGSPPDLQENIEERSDL